MKKLLIATFFLFLAASLAAFYSFKEITITKNDHSSSSIQRLKNDVNALCNTNKPRNYENIQALNEAAEYIKLEMKKAGLKPEEQKFTVNNNEYKNIISSYGPESAPRIIIGAHYDVCGDQQGADDNASGVAGILEIARMLDSLKPVLKYRVDLVAYTLEEPPFFRTKNMGSAVHADYIIKNTPPYKAMVCLEMIGYFTETPKSQSYPIKNLEKIYPDKGNFIAVVGLTGRDNLADNIKKYMMEGSTIGVESINAPASMTGIDFSDHLNYWNNNLEAVMVTNTSFYRNKNYHKPTDTPATLDYAKMAQVVTGVYNAIINIQ